MRDAKQLEVSIRGAYNDPATLQPAQRTCFDRVINQYRQILAGETSEQLLLHVDGSVGTGKSYLINMRKGFCSIGVFIAPGPANCMAALLIPDH